MWTILSRRKVSIKPGQFQAAGALELDYFVPATPSTDALVIDAKYKRRVSPDNLQQMVAYCHLIGASRALLVFPHGHLRDHRPYLFPRRADGSEVRVDLVELDCSGATVADWHERGRRLAARVAAATSRPSIATQP